MKKALAIVLILCLAFSVAFAAKKAALKVGAQLGYGSFSWKFTDKENSKNFIKVSDGGFLLLGTVTYDFSEAFAAKAEIGVNFMGKAKANIQYGGISITKEFGEVPMQFAAYLGGQYCIELADNICIDAGVGFDLLMGKLDKDTDDSFNASMGLGFEAVGCYELNKQLSLKAGGKFAWHFINTNKDLDDMISGTSKDTKFAATAFQFFVGATYAF